MGGTSIDKSIHLTRLMNNPSGGVALHYLDTRPQSIVVASSLATSHKAMGISFDHKLWDAYIFDYTTGELIDIRHDL